MLAPKLEVRKTKTTSQKPKLEVTKNKNKKNWLRKVRSFFGGGPGTVSFFAALAAAA